MEWTKSKDLTATLVIIAVAIISIMFYLQRVRGMAIGESASIVAIVMIPLLIIALFGFIIGILILRATGRESLW